MFQQTPFAEILLLPELDIFPPDIQEFKVMFDAETVVIDGIETDAADVIKVI